ncbi:hypothetical protein OGAPHI_000075 [Ogataea philodendri]|uniref:Uncharacterized protein n=1 Tax=Ogataea philodendri TaxID=1378263 RepID=A0A9P8PIB0_9ASCO|nr:uncharacterized protein OGAPHI_000075 [Ogataea philodendri]KAH3671889.1 hypothetical protein OGAPHI_000075 [Ogataea philodendri]
MSGTESKPQRKQQHHWQLSSIQQESHKVDDNRDIKLTRKLGLLGRSDSRIEHDLGIVTCCSHNTESPFGVSERSTSEQHVIVSSRFLGLVAGSVMFRVVRSVFDHTSKLVQISIWRFCLDDHSHSFQVSRMFQAQAAFESVFTLQVCLTVEIFSLDVTLAKLVTGRKQDRIGRHFLVVSDPNDVSHANVFPEFILELWNGLHAWTLHSKDLERSQNNNQQEIRVGDIGELEEDILWKK